MTTNRTEEGVRVKRKRNGYAGTALYSYEKYGKTWPRFSRVSGQWTLPVRFDAGDGTDVGLYSPSELEPGPRRFRELGHRRVRSRADSSLYGTLLPDADVGGVRWPGFDHSGRLKVPVSLDGGMVVAWRVDDLEQAPWPEPEPVSVFEEPPPGPRVTIMGTWTSPRVGRVLYRMRGNRYPGFDEVGDWRVPVQVDDGPLVYPTAQQLKPYTDEGTPGSAPRLILSPREDEATILAEADKLASAIQAKALREVAGAAADALELFASRLRDIELDGGER